ncbi:hypothetical protein [Streptomyces purpurascens]|uniref:Uncharacterized protein n=1 Tax=Streptomyces purpurascens TaxID=1924 RepID=A0ABZ1MIQ0_STREF|nr:hypothetical protein [Streptomyces purpurascens]
MSRATPTASGRAERLVPGADAWWGVGCGDRAGLFRRLGQGG